MIVAIKFIMLATNVEIELKTIFDVWNGINSNNGTQGRHVNGGSSSFYYRKL